MTTLFVRAVSLDALPLVDRVIRQPSITEWQRLESDPAELDLAAGIEARIADPLWLIGRQWQFGELKGEDAGMPIHASLSGSRGTLKLAGRTAGADELPEPLVEAERARGAITSIAVEAGLDLLEALDDAGASGAAEAVRAAFPLTLKPAVDDLAGARLAALVGSRAIDAERLAAAIEAERDGAGQIARLPATIAVSAALLPRMLEAVRAWIEDWRALLVDPAGAPFWRDRTLDYGFAMEAAQAGGTVPIAVDGYADGRLDWWSMDVAGDAAGAGAAEAVSAERVPLPIRFPGMPADRLFEFEDGAVNLGAVTVGPTGLLTMLLIEYYLAASNDWYQIPQTLPYGSAFRIDALRVRDTFGVDTPIPPAAAGPAGWAMFQATKRGLDRGGEGLFLLPATVAGAIEGEPIEEVALFRDEVANLVWAAERRVPGLTTAALRPVPKEAALHQRLDGDGPIDADMIYRLQTPTPFHWYPMTIEPAPDGTEGSLVFRRRRLRRTLAGGAADVSADPAGVVLRGEGGVFRVEEREIPRSGVIVTRSFQYARDPAGRRHLWLGRRTRVGSGEGSSRLQFDALDPVKGGG